MEGVISHNKAVLSELEPGDTVKFDRGLFPHYGLYIGNEELAHVTITDQNGHGSQLITSVSGIQFDKAEVKKENFNRVARDSKAYKANDLDSKIPPLESSVIVANALSMVGQRRYNLLTNNCEHFANWCRYLVPTSETVKSLLTTLGVGAVVAVVSVAALYYLYRWWKNKNKKQPEEYNNQ